MIGELSNLNPVFKHRVDLIMSDLRLLGWQPSIGSGMRTNQQQDALYATGRKPLNEVNALRKKAGLPLIGEAENKKPVTYAKGGQSWHNVDTAAFLPAGNKAVDEVHGNAVDIVDQRYMWDKAPTQFWNDLGRMAKKYGCIWGGDWKGNRRDVAHVEMQFIETGPMTSVVV